MHERLYIDFEPLEWRYHYDCIRIHSQAENLLIPIHGYPTLNAVEFPPRLDFGACVLNETQRKVARLTCNVPIQFEFRVEVCCYRFPHRVNMI